MAIGVTALLVTLMVTITLNVLSAWNRSSGRLSSGASARLVLDRISQDIGSALLVRDPGIDLDGNGSTADSGDTPGAVWLAATVLDNSGSGIAATPGADWDGSEKPVGGASRRLDQSRAEELRFGRQGVWLRLFTTQPDENVADYLATASAPRAIGYQIVRRNIGGQISYQLFRSEVWPFYNGNNSKAQVSTFGVGYDLFSTSPTGYNGSGMGATNEVTTVTVNGVDRAEPDKSARCIRNPWPGQLLANDVVDFGVRFYAPDASGVETEVFPRDRRVNADRTVFAATADLSRRDPVDSSQPSYAFPTSAEIVVRILTPEGVRLMQAFADGNLSGTTWWEIVDKNSQVYTRRVAIKSRPL